MFKIKEMDADAVREAINIRDRYQIIRESRRELAHSYSGSISYEEINGGEYLIRRTGSRQGNANVRSRKSLGPRSPENDARMAEFKQRKKLLQDRIEDITKEIDQRRRIVQGRGLGRLPFETGRILRKLDERQWLGNRLHVIGTSALYAYEADAGIVIDAGVMATEDIDILNDVRRGIALSGDVSSRSFVAALKEADKSFAAEGKESFRAINRSGFLVDLIGPHGFDPMRVPEPEAGRIRQRRRFSEDADDLQPVGIVGLEWLISAPKFEAITFDSRGYPVWLPTIDPRAFAAHKVWLSSRPDRRSNKAARDKVQAVIAAVIAEAYLGLSFDDPTLTALPSGLIEGIEAIRSDIDRAHSDLPSGGL